MVFTYIFYIFIENYYYVYDIYIFVLFYLVGLNCYRRHRVVQLGIAIFIIRFIYFQKNHRSNILVGSYIFIGPSHSAYNAYSLI